MVWSDAQCNVFGVGGCKGKKWTETVGKSCRKGWAAQLKYSRRTKLFLNKKNEEADFITAGNATWESLEGAQGWPAGLNYQLGRVRLTGITAPFELICICIKFLGVSACVRTECAPSNKKTAHTKKLKPDVWRSPVLNTCTTFGSFRNVFFYKN